MLLYIFLTTTQQSGGTEWTLELVLSLIAIIISVCCVVFEYFGSKRINKISLEADLYRDLYRDYLLKRIPEARNVIHYNNNIVSDTNDLIDVLNDIRRDSIFFKYNDIQYYNILYRKLQDLEDRLVQGEGPMDRKQYDKFVEDINNDIKGIYSLIMMKLS